MYYIFIYIYTMDPLFVPKNAVYPCLPMFTPKYLCTFVSLCRGICRPTDEYNWN